MHQLVRTIASNHNQVGNRTFKATSQKSAQVYSLTTLLGFFFILLCFAQQIKAQTTFPPIDLQSKPQYAIAVNVSGESLGTIIVELNPMVAPKHVRNFDSLVRIKFYDGSLFHRIIPGFMIQGGDPHTKTAPREKWGLSDSTQTRVPAEFNELHHVRGTLSAARGRDVNSATCQFFICVDDRPDLDGKYSIFGMVISGMEVVDKIVELSRDERDFAVERVEMKVSRLK